MKTLSEASDRQGEDRVQALRAFNRFWTQRIGALQAGLLSTPYSLTEARVLFELAQRDATSAADVRHTLNLDAGYLSRMIAKFRLQKLLVVETSEEDARRQVLRLTAKGRREFASLDSRSAAEAAGILGVLGEGEQRSLIAAMATIERVLEGGAPSGTCVLRPLAPGDLGWVVERHGALYAEEYQWDETFEALVAKIVAEYVEKRDARKDNAWIAELDGARVGSVFCVKKTAKVAQLRLLLMEPSARGRGIGARLVEECIRFARRAGYERIILWTNHPLKAARKIYERAGFRLEGEKKHQSYGHDLLGQTFGLELKP